MKQYTETNEHAQTITVEILERTNMNAKKMKKINIELKAEDNGIFSRVLRDIIT